MVREFQSTLNHDDYVISVDLATNLTWMETYIASMEHHDNTVYRYVIPARCPELEDMWWHIARRQELCPR